MSEFHDPNIYFNILISFIAYFGIFVLYNFILVFLIYNTCKSLIIKKPQPQNEIPRILKLLGYNYVNVNYYLEDFIKNAHCEILDYKSPNVNYLELNDFLSNYDVSESAYTKMISDVHTSCENDNKNIYDLTFNEIKKSIKQTELYKDYEKAAFDKLKRSIILSKHLNDTTVDAFFINLTPQELKKLY